MSNPWDPTTTPADSEDGTRYTNNPTNVRTVNQKNTDTTTYGDSQAVLHGKSTSYTWQGATSIIAAYNNPITLGVKNELVAGTDTKVNLLPKLECIVSPSIKYATGYGYNIQLLNDTKFTAGKYEAYKTMATEASILDERASAENRTMALARRELAGDLEEITANLNEVAGLVIRLTDSQTLVTALRTETAANSTSTGSICQGLWGLFSVA